jgi:hypothetical protein
MSSSVILNLQKNLKEPWLDGDGTDLAELTWQVAKKISPMLTPQILSNPTGISVAPAPANS